MNASDRPNTCKSRGSGVAAMRPPATGARVRNAYATCPGQGDSPPKGGLIPHKNPLRMEGVGKDSIRSGMGMRPIR